jgi:hypothetical protein
MATSGLNDDRSQVGRRDENPDPGRAGLPWMRRALVSLRVIAFAILGGALAVRWDALVAGLAGAPPAHARGVER